MNTINGRVLPFKTHYGLPISGFNEEGKISIPFNELQIDSPINFNCLYNNEIFYPNIEWNITGLILELDFGVKPAETDKLEIIFIFNE